MRAKRAVRGAVVAKGSAVRFADSVGTGRSPVGAITNLKYRFNGGPRGGGGIVVVVDGQGDAIDSL